MQYFAQMGLFFTIIFAIITGHFTSLISAFLAIVIMYIYFSKTDKKD